jgi:hypothetical protein
VPVVFCRQPAEVVQGSFLAVLHLMQQRNGCRASVGLTARHAPYGLTYGAAAGAGAGGGCCRYLVLFLKFIASVVPTIQYDYTMSVGGQ